MKIRFLGTAAAEGIPALWCECEVCRQAHRLGGRALRRRCSYRIDDDTLIDFGPDAFWQSVEFGTDLTRIRRIIFTHPHSDHLNPIDLLWRRSPWYSQVSRQLTLIGSRQVFGRLMALIGIEDPIYDYHDLNLELKETHHGELVEDGDLAIRMLNANHAPGKEAQIPVLRRGGKTILIANDTGYLPEESWQRLAGVKLDAAVIECTCGLRMPDCRDGHQGFNCTVLFRKKLLELGCLQDDTPVYANHFSHNGGAVHEELVEAFSPHGINVAYDGLELEV